jgi:hypothetical protein
MRTEKEKIAFHTWVKEVNFSKLYVHPDIKNPPNEKFVFIDTKPNEFGNLNMWTKERVPQLYLNNRPSLFKQLCTEIINIIKNYDEERK